MAKELEFSEEKPCGHCNSKGPMQIVARYSNTKYHEPEDNREPPWEVGNIFEMLKCSACNRIELRTYHWNDWMEPWEKRKFETLYPAASKVPLGLPILLKPEYEAALKVKHISANAYGVLLGRILELVCEDRQAKGKDLYQKLDDLAQKDEIPEKLVGVADKLRVFRNLGAHAILGGLTEKEVPILESLCHAILEYVYSAPYLAEQAEIALRQLKRKGAKYSS